MSVRVGAGCFDQLGEAARSLGAARAMVVTDPGLLATGYVERAADSLRAAGLTVQLFSDAGENPTTADVARGVQCALAASADLLVALGGGSAMDCAKGINFIYTNGGVMEDYWGKNKARSPMLPSIGVPTTAGTGSEAQMFALISRDKDHRKMACGDPKARFRTVLLDPELLATVPRQVRALSGIDAISHAVESFVTRTRNPLSRLLARDAWVRLANHFAIYLEDPNDVEAARQMLLGSHFAGAAIEQSMLGAAHACANPLTARYGVAHGRAVGMMLPSVVRFNGPKVGMLYAELVGGTGDGTESLARQLEEFNQLADLPTRLKTAGVREEDLASLAADASDQWTGQHNPRALTSEDFEQLYRGVF